MRTFVALVALLLAASASAQEMTFPEANQIRIGFGDLPSTDDVEPEGQWNVHATHTLTQDTFIPIAAGAIDAVIRSDQGTPNATAQDGGYQVGVDGEETFTITYSLSGARDVVGTQMAFLPDSHLFLYTSAGASVHAQQTVEPLGWPGDSSIWVHDFDSVGERFWFTVAPVAATTTTVDPGFGIDGISILLGLVAGALLWAVLVSQGIVQKRSRKQVASTAAHKVAAKESREALTGRKRLLMASLKELEMAKMNKEIDVDTYDALKADFKKQTVTVMRALEESQ